MVFTQGLRHLGTFHKEGISIRIYIWNQVPFDMSVKFHAALHRAGYLLVLVWECILLPWPVCQCCWQCSFQCWMRHLLNSICDIVKSYWVSLLHLQSGVVSCFKSGKYSALELESRQLIPPREITVHIMLHPLKGTVDWHHTYIYNSWKKMFLDSHHDTLRSKREKIIQTPVATYKI